MTKNLFYACALILVVSISITFLNLQAWVRSEIAAAVPVAAEPIAPPPVRNIKTVSQEIALHEAAQFVLAHMTKTPAFVDKFALLEHSLKAVPPELKGRYCEFGVYKGETVNFIATKTTNEVHGFDSFEGLPEVWREGFEKGTFALTSLPEVRSNVTLHKGWFNETLPGWKKKYPGPIAFLHMDADMYSSTKCVFDALGDRIVPGTVIQFDEFFNYPGWREGEYKAFMELVQERGLRFEYLGYNPNHEQVAVKVLEIGVPRAAATAQLALKER